MERFAFSWRTDSRYNSGSFLKITRFLRNFSNKFFKSEMIFKRLSALYCIKRNYLNHWMKNWINSIIMRSKLYNSVFLYLWRLIIFPTIKKNISNPLIAILLLYIINIIIILRRIFLLQHLKKNLEKILRFL